MKIKLLVVAAATLLITSCGGSEDAKDAKRFCDCSGDLAEMSKKMKEDPASVDMEAFGTVMQDFQKCTDPDGKMKAKEEAMDGDAKKAYETKMKDLVKKSCPEIAKMMDM